MISFCLVGIIQGSRRNKTLCMRIIFTRTAYVISDHCDQTLWKFLSDREIMYEFRNIVRKIAVNLFGHKSLIQRNTTLTLRKLIQRYCKFLNTPDILTPLQMVWIIWLCTLASKTIWYEISPWRIHVIFPKFVQLALLISFLEPDFDCLLQNEEFNFHD